MTDEGGALAVRVGEPAALRDAAQLVERLNGLGHRARIATHAAETATVVVREGSYLSREEADRKGDAVRRLGLTAQVVQVR